MPPALRTRVSCPAFSTIQGHGITTRSPMTRPLNRNGSPTRTVTRPPARVMTPVARNVSESSSLRGPNSTAMQGMVRLAPLGVAASVASALDHVPLRMSRGARTSRGARASAAEQASTTILAARSETATRRLRILADGLGVMGRHLRLISRQGADSCIDTPQGQKGSPSGRLTDRLSCGALKKNLFHNLRAPPASSAC